MEELFSSVNKIISDLNKETEDMKSKLFPILDKMAKEYGKQNDFLNKVLPEALLSFEIYGVDSQNEDVKKILAKMKFVHGYTFKEREGWLKKAIEEYIERKKYL